jgi:hypothetical protein
MDEEQLVELIKDTVVKHLNVVVYCRGDSVRVELQWNGAEISHDTDYVTIYRE